MKQEGTDGAPAGTPFRKANQKNGIPIPVTAARRGQQPAESWVFTRWHLPCLEGGATAVPGNRVCRTDLQRTQP